MFFVVVVVCFGGVLCFLCVVLCVCCVCVYINMIPYLKVGIESKGIIGNAK